MAGLAAGLLNVITIDDVPPDAMLDGVKLLATVGGANALSVAAAAAALVSALMVVMPAAGMLLTKLPAVAAVTLTVTVQELLTGIDAPESARVLLPPAAVTDPPQVVAGVPLLVNPAG